MHDEYIRVYLVVSGIVQGVFFRYNTYKKAVSLNLKGFVRNLDDGKVGVVAEGKKEDLAKLIEFCKKGPLLAKVHNVDIKYEKPINNFTKFEIRH